MDNKKFLSPYLWDLTPYVPGYQPENTEGLIKLNTNDQHIIIMCGMSAGFSALFGTPLAATIFSLEVISVGIMHYSALVPCVTVSMIAHFIAQLLRVPPEVFPVAAQSRISSY